MFKKRARFNILIFLLPAVIFTVIFFILPALITTFMAFTGMDYKFQWNFVGFKNFIRIMHDPLIRKITSVTVWYILGTLLIFNTTFGLVLAILTSYLSEKVGV
ncbi:MAG TPA: sugar ABC transporter permease, partial [Candidatus Atribacteria bacterium]|nr:sugar ABC transporter permease [Candidatus Atribacteria bacterium]